MQTFASLVQKVGSVKLPPFNGVRILIMPYKLEDPEGTIPDFVGKHYLAPWRPTVKAIGRFMPNKHGTAYLTIDEAIVEAGETHRRPGLHVDGVGPWGDDNPIWSSDVFSSKNQPDTREAKYLRGGMFLAASHTGCRAWDKDFTGYPGPDGDCAHLEDQCNPQEAIYMKPGGLYWCGPYGVHEAISMEERTARQLIRVSTPSNAPWYEGCTENPLGIEPDGPIAPKREAQMAYRPE
ncbi:MAG: hypothetical protein ABEI13_04190 [Candidatus Paceibacteria bacterium]